jgi:hypothetical protein
MYNLELSQAINDWQAIGIGKNKTSIAEKIIEHSNDLPPKFKTLHSKCYRHLALSGRNSVLLGANMQLPETYSSWTIDRSVAQQFNGGIPSIGRQGIIFEIDNNAPDFEVIINLHELFKDEDFLLVCNQRKNEITSFETGIGYFMNNEAEVILKIKRITTDQIWSYGGYSSSREQLAERFLGRKPTDTEFVYIDSLIKQLNINLGGRWVTGEAKDRIVRLHIETAQRLTKRE